MRAMIQCMHENNYQNLTFPSKEKELQILCDSLGVANTTKTEIKIGSVHNDERLSIYCPRRHSRQYLQYCI